MKWCNGCSKEYGSNFCFCPDCGKELIKAREENRHKKVIIVGLLVIAVVVAGTLQEYTRYKEQQGTIAENQYQKAFEEYRDTPTTSDLTINSDWTHYIKGNYIYIEGSVTNKSTKNIRYYEVGIKFLDSQSNVIETDWTNGNDVGPGESQKFDSMHKNNINYSKIQIYIKEVS